MTAMSDREHIVQRLREALCVAATRLALDPDSVTSPSPFAITARTTGGRLLRLDVSSYAASERYR